MPRNVEIKARCREPEKTLALIEKRCSAPPQELIQTDYFFHSPKGRLKLRVFPDHHGELIFYQRESTAGPKTSHYEIYKTSEPQSLLLVLQQSLPCGVVVRKKRQLYMAGRTRIHYDWVEGLGCFLELEVVLHPDEDFDSGMLEAQALMVDLGISPHDLISGAYADMLTQTT